MHGTSQVCSYRQQLTEPQLPKLQPHSATGLAGPGVKVPKLGLSIYKLGCNSISNGESTPICGLMLLGDLYFDFNRLCSSHMDPTR